MINAEEQHKIALLSILEIVLMRRGNTSYNWTTTKLSSLYDCQLRDCYENPDYLKVVLKEVYGNDYKDIVNDLRVELDDLAGEPDIARFLRVLES